MAYVRTVRTASGATAVQIVHASRRGVRDIEHLGSAHDEAELGALKAAAAQRLAAGQGVLELGLDAVAASGPLEIVSSRMGHLWDALCRAYDRLGFDKATGGDEVFRQLVLARIIEPTSKLDSLRVLTETGIAPVSLPDTQTAATDLCRVVVAGAVGGGVRTACGAGAGFVGALRRVHARGGIAEIVGRLLVSASRAGRLGLRWFQFCA